MTYYKLLHDLKWKRRQSLLLVLLRSSILIDFLMFCFILDKSGWYNAGAVPGFQVRGGALKKNCTERREARKFVGYFV